MPEIRVDAEASAKPPRLQQAVLRVGPGSALRLSGATNFNAAPLPPLILRKRFSAVSKDGPLVRDLPPMLRDGPDGPPQHEGFHRGLLSQQQVRNRRGVERIDGGGRRTEGDRCCTGRTDADPVFFKRTVETARKRGGTVEQRLEEVRTNDATQDQRFRVEHHLDHVDHLAHERRDFGYPAEDCGISFGEQGFNPPNGAWFRRLKAKPFAQRVE